MSPSRKLLVVEDDPEIRYLLSVILDDDDREIVTVTSGDDAAEALDADDFDLVVLDLILPDVDGRTLLARIRERARTATLPVVVISARGGSEIRQDCYELGADYFTEKPFDPDEVEAEVTRRLERDDGRERASLEDPVTGLLNAAGLREATPGEGAEYGFGLVQLDGFLTLSERWGWSKAEEVLAAVGSTLMATVGENVALARMGGAEFAFVVRDPVLEDPAEVGETLVRSVRDLQLRDPDGETFRLTASVGLVEVGAEASLEEAGADARRRVFRAREGGGNQVVRSDERGAGDAPQHVLVAEDDEISATILVHRLEKEGLRITRFDNGKEAYAGALEETPNLVILDVKMPGMDGFEVLERLRRTPAYTSVPIILLTSMGSEADVVRGFQLGADDYILKPFSPVELSARVWRLLRRGRSASAV